MEGPKATGLVGVNTAERVWLPVASGGVVKKAKPALAGTGGPNVFVPSVNWTVPAARKGATRAMRITGIREKAGLGATVRVVVVAVAYTV